MILGLDIATVTGWAVLGAGRFWGEIDCTPAKDAPEGERFTTMAESIPIVLDQFGVTSAIIEQGFTQSKRTAYVSGGLTAVVLVELERRNIDYMWLAASQLKAYGMKNRAVAGDVERVPAGQKRAGQPMKGEVKRAMTDYVRLAINRPLLTDNESDALWLAWYLEAQMKGKL